jgi:hypothetical protein
MLAVEPRTKRKSTPAEFAVKWTSAGAQMPLDQRGRRQKGSVSLITTFAGGDAGVWEVCGSSRSQASPWSRSLGWKSSRAPAGWTACVGQFAACGATSGTSPGERHGAHRTGRRNGDPPMPSTPPSKKRGGRSFGAAPSEVHRCKHPDLFDRSCDRLCRVAPPRRGLAGSGRWRQLLGG